MHENKVFSILKTFSKKEMTRFYEFSHSPYHNKHKGVKALVGYFAGKYPDFSAKSCSRKKILQLFPKLQDSELALYFTYVKRVLDEFLIIEVMNKDITARSIALLEQIRMRRANKLYERELSKTGKYFQKKSLSNIDILHAHYRLANESDQYYKLISKRKDDSSLQEKQRFLDYFFIAEKLKDAVEMHLREQILQVEFSRRMLYSVLEEVKENWDKYQGIPLILVYWQLYHLVISQDKSYYFELLSYLEGNQAQLSKEDLIYIYNILQNYCIRMINANEKGFLEELFKLYRSQLQLQLIMEDGILVEWHYKNIVTTALRLNEIEWAGQFIEQYKTFLDPAAYENAYRFNLAAWYHAKGEYDQVLELLLRVEYNDLRYNLGAKALLLRTYYELGETDSLVSLTSAFKQFLKRNKLLSDARKESYFLLFSYVGKLSVLRDEMPFKTSQFNRGKLEKIKSELKKDAPIFNQSWVEKKIEELEKGKEFMKNSPP